MNSFESMSYNNLRKISPVYSVNETTAELILERREHLDSQIEIKGAGRFVLTFPEIGNRFEGILPRQDAVDFYMEGNIGYSYIPVFEFGTFCLGSGLEIAVPVLESHESMIGDVRKQIIEKMVGCAEANRIHGTRREMPSRDF